MELAVQTPSDEAHLAYATQRLVSRLLPGACRVGIVALALSTMNWNNDALFDSLPVTIEYSQRLSKTIARATSLPSGVYPYRLFM